MRPGKVAISCGCKSRTGKAGPGEKGSYPKTPSYTTQTRRTETLYPSGLAVQYAYDQGRLSALNINGEPWITAIQYQPFGPVSGWCYPIGVVYVLELMGDQ